MCGVLKKKLNEGKWLNIWKKNHVLMLFCCSQRLPFHKLRAFDIPLKAKTLLPSKQVHEHRELLSVKFVHLLYLAVTGL